MQNNSLKEVVFSGLFIAIGVLLPVIFHAFGLGSTFLPMHIPVLMAGFIVSAPFAAVVGALTPILSSAFTGMPPIFPVLPFMVFELAAYGAVSSILYKNLKMNIHISLIGSMVIGRIVAAVSVWVLSTFFFAKLPGPLVFMTGAVVRGLPGIVIQLVFIPTIVSLLEKGRLINRKEVKNES